MARKPPEHPDYVRLAARFPDARNRLHFVGALNGGGGLHVADPWGRGPEAHAAAFRRIAESLNATVKP
jgi:hypothetical protein